MIPVPTVKPTRLKSMFPALEFAETPWLAVLPATEKAEAPEFELVFQYWNSPPARRKAVLQGKQRNGALHCRPAWISAMNKLPAFEVNAPLVEEAKPAVSIVALV
jgi:hypothetical protein